MPVCWDSRIIALVLLKKLRNIRFNGDGSSNLKSTEFRASTSSKFGAQIQILAADRSKVTILSRSSTDVSWLATQHLPAILFEDCSSRPSHGRCLREVL